jgi:Tol biopolymer transport system component
MVKRSLIILVPGIMVFAMILLSERPRETLLVPWSRDGEWIAFSCGQGARDENSAIYRMRPDGSDLQQVTSDGRIDRRPTWSPDGEWIAFSSERYDAYDAFDSTTDDTEIYRVRPNGADLQQLTDNSSDDDSPSWSPDGELIAFLSNLGVLGYRNIYLMNSDGQERRLLGTDLYAVYPSWSADSDWLMIMIIEPGSAIYRIRRDGSDRQLLTENNIGIATIAAWSPNGEWIVFSAKNADGLGSNLAIMRADGTQHHFITNEDGAHWTPTWSPDGQWIAYDYSDRRGWFQIYKIRPDGTERQQLTYGKCKPTSPAWSPDFDQLPKPKKADF